MKHFKTFEILPVIELNAYDYSDKEYDRPNGNQLEIPKEWDNYWEKHLSNSGIQNVEPLISGLELVSLNKIGDQDLSIIVDVQLNVISLLDEDEIISFSGGLVIRSNNEVIIRPKCCTAIYDFQNWIELIELQSFDWNQVWVGHPWIYGRTNLENLEFTSYVELNPEEINEEHAQYSFDKKLFENQLKNAVAEIHEFKNKVATILKNEQNPRSEEMAELLVYGRNG